MLDWNSYNGAPLWGPDRSAQTRAYQDTNADAEARRQQQDAERYGAVDEARIRKQMESDREYENEVRKLNQEREKIAITKGQAAATKWFNEQSVKLAKRKLEEEIRQFDMTFGEGQRQFNVTASGYMDGKPTLARDQFHDSSLRGWTQDAIALASKPADWVKLRRMQSGVAANIGSMPGLNWAQGGQIGNTTFVGEPQSNSLANVMGPMGVNVGQGAATGQAVTPTGGDWASQAAQQANQIATTAPNLNEDERALYQTAREFAMNPQQSAPGWLEALDPLTRDLLQGAAEAQGLDWASALTRHKRSRWSGGGSALAA